MNFYRLLLQNTKDIKSLERQLCCSSTDCPTLSEDVGNILECRDDGLFAPESTETLTSANNGLTVDAGVVQLGGPLVEDTTISNVGNDLIFTNNTAVSTIRSVNTLSGNALEANNTGSGNAVLGSADSGIGGAFVSNSNFGVTAQSNTSIALITSGILGAQMTAFNTAILNNSIALLTLNRSTGASVPSNNVGGALEFYTYTDLLNNRLSNSFISRWTDVTDASRTSQLSIIGVDSGTTGVLATFDGNGNVTFGIANNIVGTATNNNAVAGNIGEEINAIVSTYTDYSTTATYQNIQSIALTPGDWDISAFFTYSSNSATITAANAIFVISTTTASAAGATEGQNIAYIPQASLLGTSLISDAIISYRVSIAAPTTYYLNTQATFTLGNPQFVGSIRARRIR